MTDQPRIPTPRLGPDACSRSWEEAGHPVWGTAAIARFWVALEQPGPWGRDAFTESWLDPALGAGLQRACQEAGGRLVLVRSVGDRRSRADRAPRQVFVAGGLAGRPWLVTGAVVDPAELRALPLDLLAGPDPQPVLEAVPGTRLTDGGIVLVCTNGRRDVCCAVRGRPVALAASRARPGQVWECTHTGGHRFAATGIGLPSGHTAARLTPELAVRLVEAEGRRELAPELLDPAHDRGRSHLPLTHQAAQGWVRSVTGETSLTALACSSRGDDRDDEVTVTHVDGRVWRLRVHKEPTGERLVDSCGGGPRPAHAFVVDELGPRDAAPAGSHG
ncbi:sucrase ferredoxin [Arsenicicoccus dermatophilus]|uniref:sucrase ferredoxin n=1 Tax=Arsenicicoccus dermatophilus TaxID=1076331 RepID=UPI00391753DF